MTRSSHAALGALLLGLAAVSAARAQPAQSTDVVACKSLVWRTA